MAQIRDTTRSFALILTTHRMWGSLLIPYMVTGLEGRSYLTPEESLSPYASPDTINEITEHELEIINLANSCSDRYLFRLFSREKNVMQFLDRVTEERLVNHIRPYIEKKLALITGIVRSYGVPVYRQKTRTVNLHSEDLLIVEPVNAEPLFRFIREDDVIRYELQISLRDKPLPLVNQDMEIICNSPCIIRHNDIITEVKDMEGSKLKPFLTKKSIRIPSSHEERYFSGFIRNIVNSNRVEATGFRIDHIVAEKRRILTIERGIRNSPVIIVSFRYEEDEIFSNSRSTSFTRLKKINGIYRFEKYYRDTPWEEETHNLLLELGFFSDDRVNYSATGNSEDPETEFYSLVEQVNTVYPELEKSGFSIRQGSADKVYLFDRVELTINYETGIDWFDLKAMVLIGYTEFPFLTFRRNIIDGNREFTLPDGKVFILPEEWFKKYRNLLELGTPEGDTLKVQKQHFALLNEAFSGDECRSCDALGKLVLPGALPQVTIPGEVNAELRPYQVNGVSWMLFLQDNNLGGCLADDMGLGKTLQTLVMLLYNRNARTEPPEKTSEGQMTLFRENSAKLTSLIIVPASLVYNWEKEVMLYTPSLKTHCHQGMNRRKDTSLFSRYDIILSSYHTVRQDIEFISRFHFHYVILDESQVIKNPASQLYKSVSRLQSDHRLVLTGTPVENSLTDLWTQLNFVNNGLLGSLAWFRKEFARPIEKEQSVQQEEKLQKIIRPFILRRSKSEVASDLPPVSEQTVFCDMTDEQQKLYDEEKSAIRNLITDVNEGVADDKKSIVVLQGLMRLRLLSNHPLLSDPHYPDRSGKFDTVTGDIENILSEGHKILIFSSFVKHLDLLGDLLRRKSIRHATLTGKSTNREKIVNSFQNNPDCRVFLISMKAGGVGLNLTAADYVFILDPWWNPAVEMQALNRAHRIGQEKSVFVYRFISTGSIEEKILRLQEKKSKLAETFTGSNNPFSDLDIEEMLELLD
ncbi:MAG: DEAD/DEAH box helicase [Bacteroidales bacterium]|nr:DEAD/DEAH box helicase [Bacteroidales bacterium]